MSSACSRGVTGKAFADDVTARARTTAINLIITPSILWLIAECDRRNAAGPAQSFSNPAASSCRCHLPARVQFRTTDPTVGGGLISNIAAFESNVGPVVSLNSSTQVALTTLKRDLCAASGLTAII